VPNVNQIEQKIYKCFEKILGTDSLTYHQGEMT